MDHLDLLVCIWLSNLILVHLGFFLFAAFSWRRCHVNISVDFDRRYFISLVDIVSRCALDEHTVWLVCDFFLNKSFVLIVDCEAVARANRLFIDMFAAACKSRDSRNTESSAEGGTEGDARLE